ncbi:MAG: archaeal proteasome endopeptidase complex subunit alpha [Candidatus Aenigmarchaeota archaeon]|nr:archaeal proteasome endopeptidase complex subunit alpha [Candidatus Aenigmarchaeota archaeon]MDI6722670.1 archaeal proteasome endopeptidase complex subunit alpha [Candidatus Aenigmarchaeota archaeon]
MEIQAPMKQLGYDRASVVFSPEGRMYQVEYARKAVEKATTVVGVTFTNGVVLAATKSVQKLLVPESIEKISKIDDHIGMASCGILADARILVDYARIRSQVNRITFGEPIEINALVRDICDRKQRFTQMGGIRPFGVSLLVAGMDGGPHLYETDPSGTLREWKAQAIGRGIKDARKVLVDEYKEGMTRDKAIDLALNALKTGEKKLVSRAIEIGMVEAGQFKLMDRNAVKELVKKFV